MAVVEQTSPPRPASLSHPRAKLDSPGARSACRLPRPAEAEVDQQLELLQSYRATYEDGDEDRPSPVMTSPSASNTQGVPELAARAVSSPSAALTCPATRRGCHRHEEDRPRRSRTKAVDESDHDFAVSVTLRGHQEVRPPRNRRKEFAKGTGFDSVERRVTP